MQMRQSKNDAALATLAGQIDALSQIADAMAFLSNQGCIHGRLSAYVRLYHIVLTYFNPLVHPRRSVLLTAGAGAQVHCKVSGVGQFQLECAQHGGMYCVH